MSTVPPHFVRLTVRSPLLAGFEKHFLQYMADFAEPEDVSQQYRAEIVNELEDLQTPLVMLELDGEVAGFVLYTLDVSPDEFPECGHIREFYIARPYRRRGFGRMLLEHVENSLPAAKTGLYLVTNRTALPFWERNGFRATRKRRHGRTIYKKTLQREPRGARP